MFYGSVVAENAICPYTIMHILTLAKINFLLKISNFWWTKQRQELTFNPGLALAGFQTTHLCSLSLFSKIMQFNLLQ